MTITTEQLHFIVEDELETILNLARHNSFCIHCRRSGNKAPVEMVNYTMKLNELNDLLFEGSCKICGNPLIRYVEIGERPQFVNRIGILKSRKGK